ncbi:hypothetical protein CHU92_15250 [Flavobacterium cyanobacteriorum]|uniref:Bacteriophage abortive infection AbiH n=1 Tax=Flavobacterium cyanobacteriorum TaxID=2022802 RepID=A0A255YTT8_9FLAO|nr:AbiH family protein [Flavobacterium cyanobacteriorum]OYQ31850.1 hypothetical protein CHU92_15250 [Flavobacterium cyanobacteriorum]
MVFVFFVTSKVNFELKTNHSFFYCLGRYCFKNTFFSKICDTRAIINWVDIENEYYKLLKECLKKRENTQVKKLNEEFEDVKKLLEQYLIEEVEEKYILSVSDNVSDIFKKKNYDHKEAERFLKELQSVDSKIYEAKIQNPLLTGTAFKIDTIKFLNFNYTSLLSTSILNLEKNIFKEIQIHGKLNDPNNKVNFGFGDEMDDDYGAIEKKDDNEYLKNIKSFAYLNTSNYKKTIDFLELDKFQVYIMGHSCGLSDRILLNKIFEHKNCCSIKIYYHKNGDNDNYTDIAQNISRHFNKKEMMRERIVNKTLCEPLPQTQLPLK